jgi:hypothetical protein
MSHELIKHLGSAAIPHEDHARIVTLLKAPAVVRSLTVDDYLSALKTPANRSDSPRSRPRSKNRPNLRQSQPRQRRSVVRVRIHVCLLPVEFCQINRLAVRKKRQAC